MTSAMNRTLVGAAFAVAVVVGPVSAQAGRIPTVEMNPILSDDPGSEVSRPRFGYSSAINVILSTPDTPLSADELAGFGGGWDLGHRWMPLRNDEPLGLPGRPIGAPAEAELDLGDPLLHADVRTPALERLASRGILYRHAYTAHPLCVPSRAAFWTGRYPHTTGVRRAALASLTASLR